jgi:DNA-binding ferritin-like protein
MSDEQIRNEIDAALALTVDFQVDARTDDPAADLSREITERVRALGAMALRCEAMLTELTEAREIIAAQEYVIAKCRDDYNQQHAQLRQMLDEQAVRASMLSDQLDKAEKVIDAVAKKEPKAWNAAADDSECAFCHELIGMGDEHAQDCPWRLAKEYSR